MLYYPKIDPIAFKLGSLKVHWYGLMYLFGFLAAYFLAVYRANKPNSGWRVEQIGDLIFYAAIGVIVGGRIGYMMFYNLPEFLHNPLLFFRVWDGGMSFHGGMLGVIVATWIYSRAQQRRWVEVIDYVAPLVPIGLGMGRLGNFINGELWGRVTQVPWGLVYPHAGKLPRHPSELYEFFLEGVCLFIILWVYSAKPRPRLAVSCMFVLWYGVFRFVSEFFRQPDPQLGFIAFGWLTMGQVLSFPMILLGLVLLIWVYSNKERYYG